ncbi:MAG: hypothetical protein ACRC0R_06110 [Cetobacterium sp.]
MKSKIFFKFLTFVLTVILGYYLYNQILVLKSEYIKREKQKKIFLDEIDKTYIERSTDFYKVN